MALNWLWKDKMGKITIRQKQKDKENEYEISIYAGNCMAIFLYEYKDEDGQDMYDLWSFWADKQHVKNIMKNEKKLFSGCEVVSVELDLSFKQARPVLDMFVQYGDLKKITLKL